MKAIVAATKNASEAVGLSQITGTIEPGKLADLIVVKEDPLKNISLLTEKDKIKMVFKEGTMVKS